MSCAPGANAFIAKYFLDCVYNLRDYIGFCLGLAAILFWVVAQIPQYVKNYRTKTAEALSPWFLAQWLLGDTFNLLGCLLQGQQLPTTTYTAMYFVVADVFMMMQYIYYGALQRRREKLLQLQARRRHHHRRQPQQPSSSSSRTPPASQQRHTSGDEGKHHAWQHQPQQDRPQWQANARAGQGDLEYGIDGSTKEQTQQCIVQQGAAESAAIQDQQSCRAGTSSTEVAACVPCSSGISSSIRHCSAEAAAAAAASSSTLKSGCSPSSMGASRSVVAVGILVSLGLVSLLVPANSTHGFFPSSQTAVDVAAAAHPRSLEAGMPLTSSLHSLHTDSSSSNSSSRSVPLAVYAGHVTAPVHSSSGDSSSSSGGGGGTNQAGGGQEPVDPPPRDWAFLIGTGLGYCSSLLYLCSRLSQIHKNYTRKSSEGLALTMFMMAVCANLCTGVGIVMRTFTWQELKEQLPWMIGSLGTISLDMVILWQSLRYGNKAATGAATAVGNVAERQHLLHAQHYHHHTHHEVTHHLNQQPQYRPQHQQHHGLPRPGHVAAGGGGGDAAGGSTAAAVTAVLFHQQHASGAASSSSGMAIPGVRVLGVAGHGGYDSIPVLSSSAPVAPGWGGLSGSTTARRHAVAAAADHAEQSEVFAPLLQPT